MTKRRYFIQGGKYHCYSRGVNKQNIFIENEDYLLFMKLIEVLNFKLINDPLNQEKKIKSKLVDIFCYTLMPNHFHFILNELEKANISKFIQKILSQYTIYFNKKYNRTGTLFESRFKDKFIDNESYFYHLVGYIWNNPIKIVKPNYKSVALLNGLIKLTQIEKDFAKNYRYKKFPKSYTGPELDKLQDLNFDF